MAFVGIHSPVCGNIYSESAVQNPIPFPLTSGWDTPSATFGGNLFPTVQLVGASETKKNTFKTDEPESLKPNCLVPGSLRSEGVWSLRALRSLEAGSKCPEQGRRAVPWVSALPFSPAVVSDTKTSFFFEVCFPLCPATSSGLCFLGCFWGLPN